MKRIIYNNLRVVSWKSFRGELLTGIFQIISNYNIVHVTYTCFEWGEICIANTFPLYLRVIGIRSTSSAYIHSIGT